MEVTTCHTSPSALFLHSVVLYAFVSSVDSSKPTFSKANSFQIYHQSVRQFSSRSSLTLCVQTVPKDQLQTTIASKALIMLSEDHNNMTA